MPTSSYKGPQLVTMFDLDVGTQPLSLSSSGSAMGLVALRDELTEQGASEFELLRGAGISPDWFDSYSPPLSHEQRVAFIKNAQRVAQKPETALKAGSRQRISDFGVYGYAMISSTTFGDATRFAFRHRELAGSVLRISSERRKDAIIFRTHHPQTLGILLPFVTEFWRSTITSLFSHILDRKFIARAMYFPYPEPSYVEVYEEVFQCPLFFNSDTMEWHMDAGMLEIPCPKANELTAKICANFCDRVLSLGEGQSQLQREIRLICLGHPHRYPTGDEVASQLNMSRRTLFRRLSEEGVSFQEVLDNIRQSIAIQYLESTRISVAEIAYRLGFADGSSFRKAFNRWTDRNPSDYRENKTI